MTGVIIMATDATYTNLTGTAEIAVYSKVTITNKPEESPVIPPGEDSEEFTVAGGDDAEYIWSVVGPDGYSDEEEGTGYTFTAPSDESAFAGEYTITVTDGQGFTDSFTVLVPLMLDPNHYNLVEGAQIEIEISGAPEGTLFTFIAYDLESTEVDFEVTGWGQMTLDGNVLTYLADDIEVGDEIAFTLEIIADDSDLIDLDLDLIESGIYRVIPLGTYAGVIRDADTNNTIPGAVVVLISPDIEIDNETTIADGSFEFELPATGATYQFIVHNSGYVSKVFTSDDLSNSSDVLISAAATTPLFIRGEVTPNDPDVIVSLIIDGEVVGVRTLGFQGDFNFEFETDPGASEYLLTAANGDAYNEISRSGPLPISDADINLTAGTAGSIQLNINGDISYEKTDDIYGSDMLVEITAADSSGNPIADPQFPNGLVLTLPFNLGQVAPGDFESGVAAVYHADNADVLLAGNGIIVPVEDILIVDYIGDGQTGYVTFRVYSLSVFGIGAGSGGSGGGALSDSSNDSACFISSVAGGFGMNLPVVALGLAGLFATPLLLTGRKDNR